MNSEADIACPGPDASVQPLCIIGAGRAGSAFASALARAGVATEGPLLRGQAIPVAPAYLLCVPDRAIAMVAADLPQGALVGHCSASSQLDVLAPHEAFSIHPLMTLHGAESSLAGSWCAVDGSTIRATKFAIDLARRLGMRAGHVDASNRTLYHAAASIASNFLVTLEDAAEQAAAHCGVPREALVPLVQAAVEAWAAHGFREAITGPVARDDMDTVRRQRVALSNSLPHLLPLFDVMTAATRAAMESPGSQRLSGVAVEDN